MDCIDPKICTCISLTVLNLHKTFLNKDTNEKNQGSQTTLQPHRKAVPSVELEAVWTAEHTSCIKFLH